MQISLDKLYKNTTIRQFFSYFCVGGIAAIVEWVMFAFFANRLMIHYIAATCLAFVFSTTVNWALGKIWTFRESKTYKGKELKELILIFFVSGVGLLFNVCLMYVFVSLMGMNKPFQKTLSKIVATGIVFIWNFLIRRFVIYKK